MPARSKGRCAICKRPVAMKRNGRVQAHGYNFYDPTLCQGSDLHPIYQVGDVLASTLNDTIGQVVEIRSEGVDSMTGEVRQSLTCRKVAGVRGYCAIGECYPESNKQAVLHDRTKQ